jgi:hypothetical protein
MGWGGGGIMFRSESIESLIYIVVLTVGIVWYGIWAGKKERGNGVREIQEGRTSPSSSPSSFAHRSSI